MIRTVDSFLLGGRGGFNGGMTADMFCKTSNGTPSPIIVSIILRLTLTFKSGDGLCTIRTKLKAFGTRGWQYPMTTKKRARSSGKSVVNACDK